MKQTDNFGAPLLERGGVRSTLLQVFIVNEIIVLIIDVMSKCQTTKIMKNHDFSKNSQNSLRHIENHFYASKIIPGPY